MSPTRGSSDDLMSDPLLDAHKSIRECVRELQQATDSARVGKALRCLHEILPPHFEYEERPGGFIERLEESNAKAAAFLRQDHRDLTAELTALLDDDSPDPAATKRLAEHVARHERLENSLAIDPFSDEDAGQKWRGYA
jgi:hypothetical protein